MPAPDVAPSAIDSLSPRELEILPLLATGHTGKSIAARLGQTEAAINERLRNARRKTGVTSSRELARILDARKSGTGRSIYPARVARQDSRRSPSIGARQCRKDRS